VRISYAELFGGSLESKEAFSLAGDVTTWKTLDLRSEGGSAVAQDHQETILDIANQALEVGHRDPAEVLKAAKRVGRRAHLVANLRAYAARAIFRVRDKVDVQSVEEHLNEEQYAAELTDSSQVENIENRIFLHQLIERLSELDREIFLRRMDGMTCEEIDEAMKLNPRTAEIRFAICKNALRKAF